MKIYQKNKEKIKDYLSDKHVETEYLKYHDMGESKKAAINFFDSLS